MTTELFFALCVALSLILLASAAALTALRIAIGPTTADRLLGFHMLVMCMAGFVVVAGVKAGVAANVDLVLVLTLVGVLGLMAGARRLLGGADSDGASGSR